VNGEVKFELDPGMRDTVIVAVALGVDIDDVLNKAELARSLYASGQILDAPYRNGQLIARDYTLHAYPNPFNPATTISFDLPQSTKAQLSIFDITGRMITTLADERFTAGSHSLTFDGTALPSGVYLARLNTGNHQETQKLILLK